MRLGIVVRLVGVLVLASLVVLQGGALKTRAFEGKAEHYTVVLKAGADAQAVAADHAKKGVSVERVADTDTVKAYVASMPEGKTDDIRSDSRVSYLVLDSQLKVQHNWWDSTMITLGLHTPHIN